MGINLEILGGFVYLIVSWHAYWYIYNYIMLRKNFNTEHTPFISALVNFLFTAITIAIFAGSSDSINFSYVWFIVQFSAALYLLEFKRASGRFMNSLWQQTWFYSFVLLGITSVPLLASVFVVLHLGILVVEHLDIKAKLLIILLTIPAGIVFALLLTYLPFPFSIVMSISAHSFGYIFGLRALEEKLNLKIIQ